MEFWLPTIKLFKCLMIAQENKKQVCQRSMDRRSVLRQCLFVSLLFAVSTISTEVLGQAKYENDPIAYSRSQPTDKVYQLGEKIEKGEVDLQWDVEHGYLVSLLKRLEIPTSSQGLVFSKTSLQVSRIHPGSPRAIYFNDDIYVGWVQNGDVIEVSAADPKLGATFYSIKQERSDQPKLIRETSRCLQCHGSNNTRGRPGHIVRSVYPNETGMPEYALGTHLTTSSSKFKERFGGWFVSGTHGDMRHMGNSWLPKSTKTGYQRFQRDPDEFDSEKGANKTKLNQLFDVKPYLEPTSDIVSLMVLQHQVQMHNVITEANYLGRQAVHDAKAMNKLFERGKGFESDSTRRRFDSAAEKVVQALLFCDEFELTSPVSSTGRFATEFDKRGPFDDKKRSLRQFGLEKRLFKYPCSFLIYSDAFAGLPQGVKSRVMDRLNEVLDGKDDSDRFDHLSDEDRMAIKEILLATGIELSEND